MAIRVNLTMPIIGTLVIHGLMGSAWAQQGAPPPEIRDTLENFRQAVEEIDDATMLFTRHEWLNGSYRPEQEMEMSFRRNGDIYIRFVGSNARGREVLYRPTIDPDTLIIKPSPILPVIEIAPDGAMARRDSRHHVGMATFHALAERILGEFATLAENSALNGEYEDLGARESLGRDTHCFRADLPKAQEPTLYADRIELCFDDHTHLPVTLQAWEMHDSELQLVENYTWTQIVVNPGLGDEIFSTENPDYNF